jgi:glutamyl-Q tRNA(Asp) synthetase
MEPILNPFANMALPQAPIVSRFAPSPNGALHIGHALSAMLAAETARLHPHGRYYVRIEDIDATRSRAEHVDGIVTDLRWLGLLGDTPPVMQSARTLVHRAALEQLRTRGLIYRCFCSRSDIAAALRNTPVLHSPDGPAYPGTCRDLPEHTAAAKAETTPHSWRLDMGEALRLYPDLYWREAGEGTVPANPRPFGDVVLWRKDAPASYHLAATLDDAAEGVTHVVRGRDLYAYAAVHRLLQAVFDLPQPVYWHHPLLLGTDGEKLAKSRASQPLAAWRQSGWEPSALLNILRAGRTPALNTTGNSGNRA